MMARRPAMTPESLLAWTLLAPLVGGLVAALLLILQNRKGVPARYVRWLRLAALIFVLAGLAAEIALLITAGGSVTFGTLGLTFTISTPSRLVLLAANIGGLCAAVTAWMTEDEIYSPDPEWGLLLTT